MKKSLLILVALVMCLTLTAQVDSTLFKRTQQDTSKLLLNMDAVYNRPFLSVSKLPVAVGGYVEANWQHLGTDGVSEGHQFQMTTAAVASCLPTARARPAQSRCP